MNSQKTTTQNLSKKIGLTADEVRHILSNINFSKFSCIDMGWDFELEEVNELYLIRSSFLRKDINTGKLEKGWGRQHTTPIATSTETSIVMTAWVCIKMIIDHELLEGFEYRFKKVFNPHKTLEQLIFPETLD